MRVQDGIPTVDLEITATAGEQQFFHYTPGVKVYCSKVIPGRKCTFIMMNDEQIEVVLFPGTTIPLCSRACKFESSVTSGEQLVILNSKLVESYPVIPGQTAYLVQHCSYKNNQNKLATHHVHIHDTQLIVGKVYKLQLKNGEVDWFTILEPHDYTGIEIISVIEGPLDECSQLPTPTPTPTQTPTQTLTPSITPTHTSLPLPVNYSLQWSVDSTDINSTLEQPPATMQEIFNTWDRCLPVSSAYYPGDSDPATMSTDARAWYYDNNLGSFVQPNNTANWQHFVSPPGYYGTQYTHDVVVKSSSNDDDGIGVAGAFLRDEQTGHNYSIMFVRTQGGVTPIGGWGVIVQASGTATGGSGSTDTRNTIIPGLTICGLDIGGVARNGGATSCASSIGTNGWSSRTSRIRVERTGNIITAWCSSWGSSSDVTRASHTLDPDSRIVIDLDNTPFPAGHNLTSWDIFKQPTGVGFNTYSQPNSYYLDWSYTPPIGEQMIDMSSDSDGRVYEWNTEVGDWFVAADSLWDYVGNRSAIITDPRDQKTIRLTCTDYTCTDYTTTFDQLFNPELLGSELKAWYDASDTSTITTSNGGNDVTQMQDKSSNGFDLTVITSNRVGPDSGTRTLNGLNVLDYDKASTNNVSNQVLEVTGFNQSQPIVLSMLVQIDDEGIASDQDFLISFTNTSSPRVGIRRTSSDGVQLLTSNGTIGSGAIMTEPGTYLLTAYFNSSNSSVRVNGSFVNNGSIANTTLTHINLGENFAKTSQIDGTIAETVFYASNADITKVEGYLAHKWGVTNLLPSDHTYKNNPPLFI